MLRLARTVEGMLEIQEYRQNTEKISKYLKKVCHILRIVVKDIKRIHDNGVIHGDKMR